MAKSYNIAKKSDIKWYYLLPIFFIIAIIPLIVRLKVVPLDEVLSKVWIQENNPDFFSYVKAMAFIISTVFAFLILLGNIWAKKVHIKKTLLYIPMAVYSIFVILSTVFAEYKAVALKGFPDRYEGMTVLLCYIVITFITLNLVNNEKHIKLIFVSLMVSASILGLLGVGQYLGWDFLKSDLGKSLILPSKYLKLAETMNFKFGPHTIYLTMFNTNNVGSYTAMLFPISLVGFLFSKGKKYKIISGLFSCLMFFNWIGCRSRAGWVGGAVALILLLLLLRKKIQKNLRSLSILFICLALIFVFMNVVSDYSLLGKVGSLFSDVSKISQTETQDINTDNDPLTDVKMLNNELNIICSNTQLNIQYGDSSLSLYDEDGNSLKFKPKQKDKCLLLDIQDDKYNDYEILFYNKSAILDINKSDTNMIFKLTKEGFRFVNRHGELVEFLPIEKWGFDGRESLGTNRGYIWSRSIPIMKDTIFLGHGPDTYALHFPQHDYVGKLVYYGNSAILVDKPHNIYLQYGINTGLISLISILALFSIYFLSSIRIYKDSSFDSLYSVTGTACFLAFCGYTVSGLFNDSIVSVAPVFWVLFGIGISMNLYIDRQA